VSVPELQESEFMPDAEEKAQPKDERNDERGCVSDTSTSLGEKQCTEGQVKAAAEADDGMDELRAAQELFAEQQKAREEEYADVRAEQTHQQSLAQELQERKIANVMERGCISYQQAEELLEEAGGHAACAIRLVDPLLPGDDPDGLHSLFDSIDEDGSGTLEREEIASLAEEMDTPLTERELDVAMMAMDADGSGEVDFDEFSEWYASMRTKGRMPSWGRAISELQRRGGRGNKGKPRRSAASDAAADQRAAMAMRSR
jgi:NACalpha-BTF3-like transcription factor